MSGADNSTLRSFLEAMGIDRLPSERPADVPEREWRILTEREAGRTLQSLADEEGVSTGRIRQLEATGLRRLMRRWWSEQTRWQRGETSDDAEAKA